MVVQVMAPADAAGVAFTAHPLTGDRTETVVTPCVAWGTARFGPGISRRVGGARHGRQLSARGGRCVRRSPGAGRRRVGAAGRTALREPARHRVSSHGEVWCEH